MSLAFITTYQINKTVECVSCIMDVEIDKKYKVDACICIWKKISGLFCEVLILVYNIVFMLVVRH